MDLKISRFTFVEKLSGGRTGVFNTLTRALGVLPRELWEKALRGRADTPLSLELAGQGFLVDGGADEDVILAHWRASQAYDLTRLEYLVSPTHACNMACSYCVHGAKKKAEHMSPDTARAVLDFIMADVEAKRPLGVGLDFCGAEALLNSKAMLRLAEGLSSFCRGKGLDFRVGLISNGLGLTTELLKALVPLGLGRVRVTISGPADIHDRLRPARDGKPTYERIMANLQDAAGLVELAVNGQYDTKNGDHLRFPELLDDLTARGLKQAVTDVCFTPIVPFESLPSIIPGNPADCLVDEDPGRWVWLQNQIEAKGYPAWQGPVSNRCLANYRNSMVIDMDGRITVCPSMMEQSELDYGDAARGVDFRREARLLARELPEICRSGCAMAPLCDGGCRQQALVRTGNFDGINCLRGVYEHLLRAYIRHALLKNGD